MGVASYLVSSSVVAIMAQRLVRVVCQKCKYTYTPNDAMLEAAGITPEMAARATFAREKGAETARARGFAAGSASMS